MVERPADVLPMDAVQPSALSLFGRIDTTLRKIPGLGVFIAIALVEHWFERADFILLAAFVLFMGAALIREFVPPQRK
jgi:hypothetical protein